MEFSIVVMVKNEEENIPKLVFSLGNFMKDGGRVVIVDTGSTDNTLEISKSLGCKTSSIKKPIKIKLKKRLAEIIEKKCTVEVERPILSPRSVIFDFGKNRQTASNFSPTDNILFLDGSNILESFDYNELNKCLKNRSTRIRYKQMYIHTHKRVDTSYISRLYNRKYYKWVGRIHECLFEKTKEEIEDNNVLHENKNTDIKGPQGVEDEVKLNIITVPESVLCVKHFQKHKTRNYIDGLMLDHYETPDNNRYIYYLGRELSNFEYLESSIKIMKLCAENSNGWREQRSDAYLIMSDCYGKLIDRLNAKKNISDKDLSLIKEYENKQYKCICDGLKLNSKWRKPYILIARMRLKQKQYSSAIEIANYALDIKEHPYTFSESASNYTTTPHYIILNSLIEEGLEKIKNNSYDMAMQCAKDAIVEAGIISDFLKDTEDNMYNWSRIARLQARAMLNKGLFLYDIGKYSECLKISNIALSYADKFTIIEERKKLDNPYIFKEGSHDGLLNASITIKYYSLKYWALRQLSWNLFYKSNTNTEIEKYCLEAISIIKYSFDKNTILNIYTLNLLSLLYRNMWHLKEISKGLIYIKQCQLISPDNTLYIKEEQQYFSSKIIEK